MLWRTLIACLLFSSSWSATFVLSDVDVAEIVELTKSVWNGEIIEIEQKYPKPNKIDDPEPPTVTVTVRTVDQRIARLTTVFVDGDWRISDKEWERITYYREWRARIEKWKSESQQ